MDEPRPPEGSEPRATQRFSEDTGAARATARFDDGRATARFDAGTAGAPADAARGRLAPGERIDGRYRIEAGPIGRPTGEAEVYRCTDDVTGETVALKVYYDKIAPKEEVLRSLLAMRHPDVVGLRAVGVWSDRCYEAMDYCAGESLAEHMPFSEADLRGHLREIARGLRYLHDAGIIHRDIKPNNLFFRDEACTNLVIGDFGVSSMLEAPGRVRRTGTAAFFTLDYAAPELIDGKEVGPKTDYYALGITLLHLLAGASPFEGMDKNTILGCHFRGNVPRNVGLSPRFATLMKGLLRIDPERRWGSQQLAAWLRGEPIFTDDGVPDRDDAPVGRKVPYRSLPEITTPREMARRLKDFDAGRDLMRGFISQWLMFFDTALGKRVADLEEEFSENIELGVFKLRYLLDPMQPLEIGDLQITNVEELTTYLDRTMIPCRVDMEKALLSGCIEVWVAAMGDESGEARLLAKRIGAMRKRVKDPDMALFALLHTLDPSRPLVLGAERVLVPEELPGAVERHPELAARVSAWLFGGRLLEWMRAAHPGRLEDIGFLEWCARTYTRADPDQAVFAIRCRFDPETPFRLGLSTARTPRELAGAIARSPAAFEEGTRFLTRGWLRTWLTLTGRMKDPYAFDEVVNDPVASWPRKMEAVLHLLDPELGGPAVLADVAEIDGGMVSTEEGKTVEFTVFNGARGHLSGTISLDANSAGISMPERPFEGGPETVRVYLTGRGLDPGSKQVGHIIVNSNGGRLVIPVWFEVVRPGWAILTRCARTGALAAACAAGLRILLQLAAPGHDPGFIAWPAATATTGNAVPAIYGPIALWLLVIAGGAAYYFVQVYRSGDDDDWD
jgi:hypothetical protein